MRSRSLASVAAMGFVLAATQAPINAQAKASAYLGTMRLMPQLGKQAMPVVMDLKQAAQLDAEIIVAVNGAVVHARVLQSTDTTGALARACLEAMRGWKMKPAVSDGNQTIATLVRIRFEAPPPSADGKLAAIQATLHDIVAMAPPPWSALGDLVIHDPKEPGMKWPTVLREIKPRYTPEGMRAKAQGAVDMEIVVMPDGTVGAGRVIKGLGLGLDEAALAAARFWLFEPATLNGQPVAAKVGLVLEYRLH